MMALLSNLVDAGFQLIERMGAPGIFLLMVAENVVFVIPSEALLPFVGYVAWRTGSTAFLASAILSAQLGQLVSALAIYYIGAKAGRPLIKKLLRRYGKFLLLEEESLEKSEEWFRRHGAAAVFLCRMVPGLRTLISLPAGFSSMSLPKFTVYTFAGSSIWTAGLIMAGYALGPSWEIFLTYSPLIDVLAPLIIAAAAATYILKILGIRARGDSNPRSAA